MFLREFSNQYSREKIVHRAIVFRPYRTNEDVIDAIMKDGISNLITEGEGRHYMSSSLAIYTANDCCAFTKTCGWFYLFPIHKAELANVGLDEQDLIYWITKLNETGAGFQYLYFGEHKSPPITHACRSSSWTHGGWATGDNTFYWVGVPNIKGMNQNKPYLHWVSLRYLISTEWSNYNASYVGSKVNRLAYFNIPRITVMLHEDYGMDFFKAFLYAHVAAPFKSANGLTYSDYMGVKYPGADYSTSAQAPCVNVTAKEFSVLWDLCGDYINYMLTQAEYNERYCYKQAIKDLGIRHLKAPYDYEKCFTLFHNKQYQEFINEIENSYKEHEEKVAQ